MNLADGHVHLFRAGYQGVYGRPSSGGDDLEIYRSLKRTHHIDVALVIGYEGEPRYHHNNAYVAELSTRHRWIAPLAYMSPKKVLVPDTAFLGVAIYLRTASDAAQFSAWPEGDIAQLRDIASIISINAIPETLGLASETIRRLAGCQVLISHLGVPGPFARPPSKARSAATLGPLLALSSLSHVGVKLSGLYALTSPSHAFPHRAALGLVDQIADAYGVERLVWGSDFSPALDHVSFAQTVHAVGDLKWTESERFAIMGGNLRRIVSAARAAARGRL